MTMRVAYVTQAPFISGAERSLQILLRFIRSYDVEPIVLCPDDAKIEPWCRAEGIRVVTCRLSYRDKWHAISWYRSVREVRGILKREKVDVVHTNQLWCYPAVGEASRQLGIPRVCHLRDELGPASLDWWCRSGAEAFICISDHIQRQLAVAMVGTGWRTSMQTVINPVIVPPPTTDPVVVPPWMTDPESIRSRGIARAKLGVSASGTVFGFIGQVVPVKGLVELLKAVSVLRDRGNWHLVVAGRDPHPGQPYEHWCRHLVEDLGLANRVTFLGFLEQTSTFYEAIDVAVVPSLEEPLGRIPLEAGAHAKPSVAFSVGGLPETIIDGVTGILVPAGSVAGLRSALERFLDDPRPEMGIAAREFVSQHCDPKIHAETVLAIYRRALAGCRKTPSNGPTARVGAMSSIGLNLVPLGEILNHLSSLA